MLPSPEQRIGHRYAGRYDLRRILGRGGMGVVYEAEHVFTGRRVAVKVLSPEHAGSPVARERFVREAQAPSSIRHPGIVEVLDAGVGEDGSPFLALELLEGETLARAMSAGRVDPSTAVEVAVQILDALEAAHRAGLVHRDVKPENVFLSRDPRCRVTAKLLDFGITRPMHDIGSTLTVTGAVVGTPRYMSPEQARAARADARSDVYSVGAVLFHALTGRNAFEASNYNEMIAALLTSSAPPVQSVRREIPADVARAVDRALAVDPAARFASAAEMRDALARCAPMSIGAPVALTAEMTPPAELPQTRMGSITSPWSGAGNDRIAGARPLSEPRVAHPKRRSRAPILAVAALAAAAIGGAGAWAVIGAVSTPRTNEPTAPTPTAPPPGATAPSPTNAPSDTAPTFAAAPPATVDTPAPAPAPEAQPSAETAEATTREASTTTAERPAKVRPRRPRADRVAARPSVEDDAAAQRNARCRGLCQMEHHHCAVRTRTDSRGLLECYTALQRCQLQCEP